jgi:hypothetical protein
VSSKSKSTQMSSFLLPKLRLSSALNKVILLVLIVLGSGIRVHRVITSTQIWTRPIVIIPANAHTKSNQEVSLRPEW